uniref:Uncharacterized protein n=1 Tax=Ditylenchus dipsaci TaxID=166011 RepID=A0A915DQG1_9BILA
MDALYLKVPTSDENKEKIREWYEDTIFSLRPSKQLINHRNPAEADELIKPLFRLEKFRNFVEKLLEGQDIEVNFNNLQMDNDDMDGLRRLGKLASPKLYTIPISNEQFSQVPLLDWFPFSQQFQT